MKLSLLYRGSLASCNYGCTYCPFAKRTDTREQLARDRAELARFTARLASLTAHRWRILFTPWGEALVRSWYRRAVVRLSQLPHVESVAVQTNLSAPLDWVAQCAPGKPAFWATYHPTEVARAAFVAKAARLHEAGVRISVGMVAVPDALDEILALRRELPASIYLWLNAQQPRRRPYTADELRTLAAVDPQFPLTAQSRRTFGLACRTGESVFSVDGAGTITRCHFVDEPLGNLHDDDWESSLRPRTCPNRRCDCFVGWSHLPSLGLERFFGDGLLERIPKEFVASAAGLAQHAAELTSPLGSCGGIPSRSR